MASCFVVTFGLVGRLGLGVGVKTSLVILCGGGLGA